MGCSSSKDAVEPGKVQGGVVEGKKMPQDAPNISYVVTVTADGDKWLHSVGENFVFAHIPAWVSPTTASTITMEFQNAVSVFTYLKRVVEENCGQHVVNGLYISDPEAMAKAMESVDGMSKESTANRQKTGDATVAEINLEFFASVLPGVGGDLAPLTAYLTEAMGKVQAQAKISQNTGYFGTIIGFVSAPRGSAYPVTTFTYAYSSDYKKEWFTNLPCGSSRSFTCDYTYTAVNYKYDFVPIILPPSKKL